MGAQWFSGRVLDSRPKGRGFEPHRRHISRKSQQLVLFKIIPFCLELPVQHNHPLFERCWGYLFYSIWLSPGYPFHPVVSKSCKGCFTYTPNPNRNRTETVTATELYPFVFGRPFTYEPNPWTKSKKMPV